VHVWNGQLLAINGAELKQGVDVVRTSTDVAVKKRQKVFRICSWLFRVAADSCTHPSKLARYCTLHY